MDLNEYQRLAEITSGARGIGYQPDWREDRETGLRIGLRLATAGLGVAGEAGEVADLLKKTLGHQHPLDLCKLERELGDVLWYVAEIASACGLSLSSIAAMNIDKLKARYPEGFSSERSINREYV